MKYVFGSILLLIASVATASEFTQEGGFFWKGNSAYTRRLVKVPGCYSGGCYKPGKSYYRYSYSHEYVAPAALPSPADSDDVFLNKQLNVIKFDLKVKSNLALAKAVGSPVQYGTPSYGTQYSISAAGSTQYGYVAQQQYAPPANLDQVVREIAQQIGRLTENNQSLTADMFGGVKQLGQQLGSDYAKVAILQAAGQSVGHAVRATQENKSQQYQFQATPFTQPQRVFGQSSGWAANAQSRCASCHSGSRKEGGFDVSAYPSMTVDQKVRVLGRLITTDQNKRMPRNADGSPGQLSADEMALWMQTAQMPGAD